MQSYKEETETPWTPRTLLPLSECLNPDSCQPEKKQLVLVIRPEKKQLVYIVAFNQFAI